MSRTSPAAQSTSTTQRADRIGGTWHKTRPEERALPATGGGRRPEHTEANERGGAARNPAPPHPSAAPPPRGAPPSRGSGARPRGRPGCPPTDHVPPEGTDPFVAPSKLGIPSPASTR